ncbi:DUF1697 domain-containing protein [Cumulibacter manganitolerans]|uniref:DUF1697 domain-containing protein n=1 Tax=Cumulibacter manganitolerans TaxID=1884992 RepID=UPI001295ED0E|nr:DUF1697 domain-containing protein [Cumulibacter manganitolerans]
MTKYAALLRGINVGGNRKVPMAELRELAESLGLEDVSTYIASGNLLFSSSKTESALTDQLHEALESRFGFAVDVVVVSHAHLQKALAGCPFDGDPKQVIVTFLSAPYDAATRAALQQIAADGERVDFGPSGAKWLYVDFAGGLARSKLATKLASVAKDGYATTRNIRTVEKLVELLG